MNAMLPAWQGPRASTRGRVCSAIAELEENDMMIPPRPTEAELDALEAKYRTETPAAVSELGLPVDSAAATSDGTLVSDTIHMRTGRQGRGRGRRGWAAARVARAAAEGSSSPAGSLPVQPNPDSDLGAETLAIREADEALAAIGADVDAAEDGDVGRCGELQDLRRRRCESRALSASLRKDSDARHLSLL